MSVALHIWVGYVIVIIHMWSYIIWSCFLLHKFKMIASPHALFIFVKFWVSGLLGGCNGQKIAQNDKNKLSPFTSQELYLISLWFSVDTCKLMISPAIFFFHIFKILIFWVLQSSSINAKKKLWGVHHLLYMCMIFSTFWYL